jgi:hypothetical protein
MKARIVQVSVQDLLTNNIRRLQRVAAKLTHVGEQTGPVLTIVIQTLYYLPSLEIFIPFRSSRVSYVNDELPLILNFSVSPDEFARVVESAAGFESQQQGDLHQVSLSLTVVVHSDEELVGAEVLVTRDTGVLLHAKVLQALDETNGVGRSVLKMQQERAYK